MDRKPELDWLLCCLGLRPAEAKTARLEQLPTPDWEEVIRYSDRYEVTPLLYQHLCTSSPRITIPAGAIQTLREGYLRSLCRNTRLYHELSKVLEVLRGESIPTIVLKGAVLAELLYGNIALRPMNNVDLLVKDEDIRRADKALLQQGYKDVTFLLSKRHIQWVRHLNYTNGVIHIDVHREICELPNLNPWTNASSATIASTDVLVLGAEDLLLHLCMHLAHNLRTQSPRLTWWCDIARVLESCGQGIGWDYVIRVAREHKAGGAVCRILCTISERFDKHVPADVLTQLKGDGVLISINDMLPPGNESRREAGELETLFSSISRIPSIRDKLYHVFKFIFPRREYMLRLHPVTRINRVYLYYFIRLGMITAKSMKALCQFPSHLGSKWPRGHASRPWR